MMPSKYNLGDTAYIIENGMAVREVKIIMASGDFLTLQFTDSGGFIRLRESRLFPDRESAEAALKKKKAPGHWER